MKTDCNVNVLTRYKFWLKYNFFIDFNQLPSGITQCKDIDFLFESSWNQLKNYFIPDCFFGENQEENSDRSRIRTFDEKRWKRDDFEIDVRFMEYIKVIFKRYCILNALEVAKRIDSKDEYVSLFHISQVWKDCGYFSLTKNNVSINEPLYRFKLGGRCSIDKQMSQKLNPNSIINRVKNKPIIPGKYKIRKYRDFSAMIKGDVKKLKSKSKKKDEKHRSIYYNDLLKEGKKINTYAKRYRKKDILGYTNNNIIEWKHNKQHVPFSDSDLVYTLLTGSVSDFEAAVTNLGDCGEVVSKADKRRVEKCVKSHFLLANNFREYDKFHDHVISKGSSEALDTRDNEEKRIAFKYDDLDTMLLNNSIEKYFHIDLLYELLHLRRKIEEEFYFDNSICDDILMEMTKLPIAFTRILFAEYPVNRINANMIYESDNGRSMIRRAIVNSKLDLNRRYQQLEWINKFENYVKQLTGLFIPLLEKTFLCSLYPSIIDVRPNMLSVHNKDVLNLLYGYTQENIDLFLFDATSDSTIRKYYDDYFNVKEGREWSYMKQDDHNQQIRATKEKISDFLSDGISKLSDSEYIFLNKFYKTIFSQKGFNTVHNSDLFERYEQLLQILNSDDKQENGKEQSEHKFFENYRKEKARLDIDFITGIPFVGGVVD